MIRPRHLPPDAYFDDPAEKIDPVDPVEHQRKQIPALASTALTCVGEWITRGRTGVKNRALRSDIVLLSIAKRFLPCKRPCAAWVGRQHGVSRQRARDLWQEFSEYIGPRVQFDGQRFLNLHGGLSKRRGRGRKGPKGPQPGPVAGA